MQKLENILVIMDLLDPARLALARATLLARHFGARLELFLCDTPAAYEFGHTYDKSDTARARLANLEANHRYLESTRRSMAADVPVTVHAACESPLCEAVSRRVRASEPDLVVKAAGRVSQRPGLDGDDWQVARTCPAPLLLTHGRPWQARPRFGVLAGPTTMAQSKAASFLARGVDAQLDLLAPGRPGGNDFDLLIVPSDPALRVGSMVYRHLDAGLLATLDCDVLLVDQTPSASLPQTADPALRNTA